MFPLNRKMYQMNTRNKEKYLVQYANTERLKKSAIVYMQNLLNKDEKQMHKIYGKMDAQ